MGVHSLLCSLSMGGGVRPSRITREELKYCRHTDLVVMYSVALNNWTGPVKDTQGGRLSSKMATRAHKAKGQTLMVSGVWCLGVEA